MSNTATDTAAPASQDQLMAAMFANMVIQHTNMAAVFLGLAPNPQTGETKQELDHARYFIDQLEMLQVKTKGNLTKEEDAMLKQSLAGLRMAFVNAVNQPAPVAEPAKPEEPPASAPAQSAEPTPSADDAKKKFSKKY